MKALDYMNDIATYITINTISNYFVKDIVKEL